MKCRKDDQTDCNLTYELAVDKLKNQERDGIELVSNRLLRQMIKEILFARKSALERLNEFSERSENFDEIPDNNTSFNNAIYNKRNFSSFYNNTKSCEIFESIENKFITTLTNIFRISLNKKSDISGKRPISTYFCNILCFLYLENRNYRAFTDVVRMNRKGIKNNDYYIHMFYCGLADVRAGNFLDGHASLVESYKLVSIRKYIFCALFYVSLLVCIPKSLRNDSNQDNFTAEGDSTKKINNSTNCSNNNINSTVVKSNISDINICNNNVNSMLGKNSVCDKSIDKNNLINNLNCLGKNSVCDKSIDNNNLINNLSCLGKNSVCDKSIDKNNLINNFEISFIDDLDYNFVNNILELKNVVMYGYIRLLPMHINKNAYVFKSLGISRIMEIQLPLVCLRNIFYWFYQMTKCYTKLPVENIALLCGMTLPETECLLLNCIDKGLIRGYLSLNKNVLVLSKENPFPTSL